ncbi:WAT1-related protein At5g47470-like [Cicer arietinum]|uniref:WAT1-related protein n=1 Tax=Cicer arietinum TaxID=3827 RepID=A0A1S3EE48_CICAR|nr:WAT1-related protein At5g47470-like [Cicer arietinum]XP_012573649.1 WAT1-related protein At5g47470-like [Cicer arietinum]XP_012573650.1 WAT1-related protein At5g47470-like [Cicer arietinum]
MVGTMNSGMMEDVAVIGGLIGVQFFYAGNAMLMSYIMSLGLTSFTIVIFSSFATFLILFPFVLYYERSKWPKKFSFKLFSQFLLLALGGVTVFQSLFLKGINLTSPAMGTAMPNLAPGFIFVIAWMFRLEKVDLSCTYSRVKIIGTLLCVLGAFTMSLMQSISAPASVKEKNIHLSIPPPPSVIMFDRDKIIGCLYLLASILVLSSTVVLQAFTLGEFPAPMSVCAITSFLGGFITAAAQLLEYHKINTGWPLVSVGDMIGYSLLSGAVTGICLSFSAWALEKRGPVFVSMFSPVGTVCSVIFSIVTLGDSTVNIGSIVGMFLMFTGLYFVLWAKGKEDVLDSEFDAEKPLLS